MKNYIQVLKDEVQMRMKVNKNLLELYTLLILVKGEDTTLSDVHDAWSIDKNRTFPKHWSIVPFEKLSKETQEKDQYYLDIIKSVSRKIKNYNKEKNNEEDKN